MWVFKGQIMVFSALMFLAAVGEVKMKSAKSREQSDRAFHANSALFIAISSGSLELYGETLIWARRFVKDPVCFLV